MFSVYPVLLSHICEIYADFLKWELGYGELSLGYLEPPSLVTGLASLIVLDILVAHRFEVWMPPVSFDTFPGLGLSFVCQSMFFSQEEQKGLGGDNLLPSGGVVYSIQAFPGPFSSPYLFLVGSCCFLHFYDYLFIWVQTWGSPSLGPGMVSVSFAFLVVVVIV